MVILGTVLERDSTSTFEGCAFIYQIEFTATTSAHFTE